MVFVCCIKVVGRPQAGDYTKALQLYEDGRHRASGHVYDKMTDEQKATQTAIMLGCRNNMAQCHLKLDQADDALKELALALEIDPASVKALYRRGALRSARQVRDSMHACTAPRLCPPARAGACTIFAEGAFPHRWPSDSLQDYEDAAADFEAAIAVDPTNKAVLKEKALLKKRYSEPAAACIHDCGSQHSSQHAWLFARTCLCTLYLSRSAPSLFRRCQAGRVQGAVEEEVRRGACAIFHAATVGASMLLHTRYAQIKWAPEGALPIADRLRKVLCR